jgi:hypothetical protein
MVYWSRKEISSRLKQSSRDNCVNWRGSALRSGDNVIFRTKTDGGYIPGQIIDIKDYRDVPRKELESPFVIPKDDRTRMILIRHRTIVNIKNSHPLESARYCHVPDSMNEVADTLLLEWVLWNSVVSPCFIFHIDTIQRGLFTCKGMARCYYIRFLKSRNGKYIPISEGSWLPFYRDELFPDVESYPEVLWTNILALKNEVQKAMCRGGQWDGRTVSAKLNAQPSFFRYLKDEVADAFGEELLTASLRCSRSKKVIFDNLAASRRKIKYHGELIRILNEDELDAVRKVLGSSFGVGVTHAIPSLKQLKENPFISGTVWLQNSDSVRIVSCCQGGMDIGSGLAKPLYPNSQTNSRKKPIKLLCSYRGLDIRFTTARHGTSEISVQCRFVKVRADSQSVHKVLGSNVSYVSDTDSSFLMVSEGDFLTLDNDKVYVVRDVLGDGTVRCESPSHPINDPIVISVEEANEALNRKYK